MRITCTILLLTVSTHSFSQKEYNKVSDVPDALFLKVESSSYTNLAEWKKFLEVSLNGEFFKLVIDSMIPKDTYKVFFKFIVDKDGSLRDIIALQNPYGLGQIAVNVARKYPKKWTPAEQNGKKVQSYHMQPVMYIIGDEEENDTSLLLPRESKSDANKVSIDAALFKVIDEPIQKCCTTAPAVIYY